MRRLSAPGFSRSRWYVVGFLALLYALSMIDRFMLAVLAQPMMEDLGISNVQLGLLLGGGFALVYSLAGVPIAHWADHGNRKRLVVLGVIVWSSTTIACAFASSFEELLILRAGVAIGEAALSPATLSMIADLFQKEKRALPTSIYMSVGSLMASGAFIVGAAALHLATDLQPAFDLAPWRGTFIILGVPGLIIAFVGLVSLREPPRTEDRSHFDQVSTRAIAAYLRKNASTFVPLFVGTGAISSATLGLLSWAPTVLQRSFGMDAATASYTFGVIGIPSSLAGSLLLPWFAERINRSGRADGVILILLACVGLGPVAMVLGLVAGTTSAILPALAIAMFMLPSVTVLTSYAFQILSPGRMRARMIAINFLVINLFGYTIGPLVIASAADSWFEGPFAAGYGLAILMGVAGSVAFVAYCLARINFANLCRELQNMDETVKQ